MLILSSFFTQSQIINVENIRKEQDSAGWSGNIGIKLQLTKNKNRIFNFSNRIRVQYSQKKHLWLFINDIDFKEANSTKLVSKNSQHLRYNYRIDKQVTWEAFAQSQSDEISDINFRGLIGTGPRFNLSKKENYKYFIGTLLMYEYEVNKTSAKKIFHNDLRGSFYFSLRLFPRDNISFVSTTYYQPKINKWSDFRMSSQSTLAVKIIKNLALTTTFTYQFDEFPVVGIPKEQYKLTNGLVFSFD